jgi:hypothetical protein
MKRFDLRLLVAVLAFAPLSAGAQLPAGGPKPDVMVVIGSSRTMEFGVGYDAQTGSPVRAVCSPAGAARDRNQRYTRSRLETIKGVLTGRSAFEASEGYWCREADPPPLCGALPNAGQARIDQACGLDAVVGRNQAMCCAAPGQPGQCAVWQPCGADSGGFLDQNGLFSPLGNVVTFQPGNSFTEDGLIHTTRDSVRWGLMTFDGHPDGGQREDGLFSYPRQFNVGLDPALQGAAPQFFVPANFDPVQHRPLDGLFFARDLAEAQSVNRAGFPMNLGIRNEGAPFGGLVASGWRYDPALNIRTNVGETSVDLTRHNAFVMERVRGVTSSREAPIAAALADALDHFEREAAAGGDPSFACRQKSMVLIVDQGSTDYTGGKPCNAAPDCLINGVQGQCARLQPVDGAPVNAPAGTCRMPEGFPYEAPATYAARLRELGVPVFVVAFSAFSDQRNAVGRDDRVRNELKRIAAAGSPGMGFDGVSDGFFRADDEGQLRRALEHAVNNTQAGVVSHTRPLITSPRRGDETDLDNDGNKVVQWRVNAFSEIPGGGDAFRYGRIERVDYGCGVVGRGEDQPGARDVIGRARLESVFAARDRGANPRRALSRAYDRRGNLVVLGAAGASVFDQQGSLGGAVTAATLKSMTGVGGDADAVAAELQRVGQFVNGYFGQRGLLDGQTRQAQLGEFLDTELTPLVAPQLDLSSPGYRQFQQANRDRPTLMAAGGNDGQLHLFRLDDGFEVLNVVPRSAWNRLATAPVARTVNGPIDAADVAACRSLGQGNAACPAGLDAASFRSMLVGAVGRDAANIYGVDLTNVRSLARRQEDGDGRSLDLNQLFPGAGAQRPYMWDVTDEDSSTQHVENGVVHKLLGPSVSRPALTHVRYEDAGSVVIRAAVVVGCGDDNEAGLQLAPLRKGRCVLVLDATTGLLIKRFDNTSVAVGGGRMDAPMTGSPSVWPQGGVAPAERAFIGDAYGRMWRLDLRDLNPANWKAEAIFPFAGVNLNGDYETGRTVFGRPSVLGRQDGSLAVVFATGEVSITLGANQPAPRAAAVSLVDKSTLDANGRVKFSTLPSWIMPLAESEVVTGEPVVYDGTLLMTTAEKNLVACSSAQGRLYGVHAWEVLTDANGNPTTFPTRDNRRLSVKPRLPVFNQDGSPGQPAISYLLPAGRIAYGATVAAVPGCGEDESTTTEVVLNLSDTQHGGGRALNASQLRAEVPRNNGLAAVGLDGGVFARADNAQLSVCLNCDKDGKALGSKQSGKSRGPFPSSVSYWGSTFAD